MVERDLPSGTKHGFAPIPTADSIFVSITAKSVVATRSEWQQNKYSGAKFCSVVGNVHDVPIILFKEYDVWLSTAQSLKKRNIFGSNIR
jgi:hypothetical protein